MTTIDALVAFVVTLAGCIGLMRLVPQAGNANFDAFLASRARRMTGRIVVVILVVALGVGLFERSAPAVTAGALAGWLLATIRELRSAGREDEGRSKR